VQAGFGYIRFAVGNDELSSRAKFVLVSWAGPGIKVLRKARLSVHIADVKKVVKARATRVERERQRELRTQAHTGTDRHTQAGDDGWAQRRACA
jgi:hypothetical protein